MCEIALGLSNGGSLQKKNYRVSAKQIGGEISCKPRSRAAKEKVTKFVDVLQQLQTCDENRSVWRLFMRQDFGTSTFA